MGHSDLASLDREHLGGFFFPHKNRLTLATSTQNGVFFVPLALFSCFCALVVSSYLFERSLIATMKSAEA